MHGRAWPAVARRARRGGVLLAVVAAGVTAACARWHATPLPGAAAESAAAAADRPGVHMRLVLRDGRRVGGLRALRVEGDSVIGVRTGAWGRLERVAVPVSAVARVERADATAVNRAGLGVILAAGAAAAAAAAYGLWVYVRS